MRQVGRDGPGTRVIRAFYLMTATALFTHEVDSGYRQEWQMFGIPGGAAVFLLLHVPLFAYFTWGYGEVVRGGKDGVWASILLGSGGVLAAVLHTGFLVQGDRGFGAPISIGLLAACGLLGAAQIVWIGRSRLL